MNQSPVLRLTPSNSPFLRASSPRSPTKISKNEESGLKLKRVIGTTCANASGFASLPSAGQFAYTAGAAAVVCTIEHGLNVSQRFYKARPGPAGGRDGYFPSTPNHDLRNRAIGNLRGQSANGSPLSASLRDWSDSPTGKSATAKDRVKAATSVALSPDGKWVAVGETGYKPRVLIFSNRNDAYEAPLCALSEHTFGVHALAFSPDSRFLASIGTVNDGFLYIWAIDERTGMATLHSSNKCTSIINQMMWLGRSVLTIGLRYVKLWKPEEAVTLPRRPSETISNISTPKSKASEFGNTVSSPRHKVLAGKNGLLGDLLDANFVAAVPYGVDKAIMCADTGDLCLIDATDSTLTLIPLGSVDFRISAAMSDTCGDLVVAGANGQSKKFSPSELGKRGPANLRRDRRSTLSSLRNMPSSDAITTTAMVKLRDVLVELDSRRSIKLTRFADSRARHADIASHQLAAHSEAILGVKCLEVEKLPDAAFLTFAATGSLHIWNSEGSAIASHGVPLESSPAMYDVPNELRAISAFHHAPLLAAGDRYGTLSVLDIISGWIIAQVRAHSAEIVDVVCFERCGVKLIATASRDRTVQLFACNEDGLELLQTMDEHAAAVTALSSVAKSSTLLSCSTDRTIVIREATQRVEDDALSVVFIVSRTITLKSSPLSMCLGATEDELLVSMADRTICKYGIKNGQVGFSFKCSDGEGGEAVTLSKILYTPSLNGNPTIIGVSSSDKSVRLYSEYGSLIARDWGHTEGITDAVLLHTRPKSGLGSPSQLVTVAADSTIFMWDTTSQAGRHSMAIDDTLGTISPAKHVPLAPPLRKVLSYSELAPYKRENSIGEDESPPPASPNAIAPKHRPTSPRRLRSRPSRTSVLPPPKLEPSPFQSPSAQSQRESTIRKRSPSPTNPKAKTARKPALGMSLRSESSDNVLSSYIAGPEPDPGSIASSTESMCRNLRAYRKELANASADTVTPVLLRELATELKLTARMVDEKSQGKAIDESTMIRLLDQASNRIVDGLDERIKECVESEVRRSSGTPPLNGSMTFESSADVDAVVGALGKIAISNGD